MASGPQLKWFHQEPAFRGVGFVFITHGQGYYQLEGSDRWNLFQQEDLILFPTGKSYILTHHPVEPEAKEAAAWITGRYRGSKENLSLLIHPLVPVLHLKKADLARDEVLLQAFRSLNLQNHQPESEHANMDWIWLRLLQLIVTIKPGAQGLMKALMDPELRAITEHLCQNFHKEWSIETMAAKSGLTKSRLQEHFKQATGLTPTAFLSVLRLRAGRALLKRTHYSIDEISKKVGYSSDEFFIRGFYKRYGTSPLAYRIKRTSLARGARFHH